MEIKRMGQVMNPYLDSKQSGYSPSSKQTDLVAVERIEVREDPRQVDVSTASRLGSQRQGGSRNNDDLERSGLPEDIKNQIAYLRELQRIMMAKLTEMQRVMENQTMRADMRKQRSQMLTTEIMVLETTYMTALRELEQLMQRWQLPLEQQRLALDLL